MTNKIKSGSKVLNGIFSLDHNIKIYIPSTVAVNVKANTDKTVTQALKHFGAWFGGATSYKAMGSWVSKDKGLIVEKITIVESYADAEGVEKHLKKVLSYARKLKKELSQEAISIEYDNRLYFI